jgi:hypothetical protein
MPDFFPPLIDDRGRLLDFSERAGDERYAKVAGLAHGRKRLWGGRVLLAADPQNNPNLGGLVGRTSATVIDTGDLGRCYPVNIQIRYAKVDPRNGQPIVPITERNPRIGLAGSPNITLTFTVRRGIDPLSPVVQDQYVQPALQLISDSPPFDTLPARSLGLDVKLEISYGSELQRKAACLWLEATATPVEQASIRDTIPGYSDICTNTFIPATVLPGLLLHRHFDRCQFLLCNTSTNGDLYVLFGDGVPSQTSATFVLPKGGANVYESPIGGFAGNIYGLWVGSTLHLQGGCLVTEGTYKSSFIP